jgi:DNA-binding NtrC family response regulator
MKLNDAISVAVRVCMQAALEQTNGNVRAAAVVVGVHRTAFYKLAAKHGLELRAKRTIAMPELRLWRQP